MQPQYSQGAAPSHHPPPYAPPEVSQANGGSITSSLRQWRKKDYLEKQQSTEQPPTSVAENSSHVARVAPHTYYPRLTNDVCHYQHQYSEYGVPYKPPAPAPVKYSEIVDNPQAQPIEHITPVIPKVKDKEFGELCSVPPQPHLKQYQDQMTMKQSYPDGTKQTYSDPAVHHQYIPKESQIHPFLQKQSQMHQYMQKEPYQQFLPKYSMQGQYPQSYPSEPNNFLAHLNKINPRMAQSIINDTHLRDPQIPMYHNLEQNRSYPQPQRMYAPSMHSSPTHAHRNIPQSYNYAQPYNYNVKSSMQPSDPYNRVHQYQHNVPKYLPEYKMNAPMEQPIPNISPQHMYNESVRMNYAPMPPKISPNYPHCSQLEYAQHYQHRRAHLAQEYYAQYNKSAYAQNPQISPEDGIADGRPRKSSLKQYLETWVEEDMSGNLPDLVVSSNNLNDGESMESLKDTTEIPNENLPHFLHLQQFEKLPDNIRGYYHSATAIPPSSRRIIVENSSEVLPESSQLIRGNSAPIVPKLSEGFVESSNVVDGFVNQSQRKMIPPEEAPITMGRGLEGQIQNLENKVVQIHIIEDSEATTSSNLSSDIAATLSTHPRSSSSSPSDTVIMQSNEYQHSVPFAKLIENDEGCVIKKRVTEAEEESQPLETEAKIPSEDGIKNMPVIDESLRESVANIFVPPKEAANNHNSVQEDHAEEDIPEDLQASETASSRRSSICSIYKAMEHIHGENDNAASTNNLEPTNIKKPYSESALDSLDAETTISKESVQESDENNCGSIDSEFEETNKEPPHSYAKHKEQNEFEELNAKEKHSNLETIYSHTPEDDEASDTNPTDLTTFTNPEIPLCSSKDSLEVSETETAKTTQDDLASEQESAPEENHRQVSKKLRTATVNTPNAVEDCSSDGKSAPLPELPCVSEVNSSSATECSQETEAKDPHVEDDVVAESFEVVPYVKDNLLLPTKETNCAENDAADSAIKTILEIPKVNRNCAINCQSSDKNLEPSKESLHAEAKLPDQIHDPKNLSPSPNEADQTTENDKRDASPSSITTNCETASYEVEETANDQKGSRSNSMESLSEASIEEESKKHAELEIMPNTEETNSIQSVRQAAIETDPTEIKNVDSCSESSAESYNHEESPVESYDRGESPVESYDHGESPVKSYNRGNSPVELHHSGKSPIESCNLGNSPIESHNRGESPIESHYDEEFPVESNNHRESPVEAIHPKENAAFLEPSAHDEVFEDDGTVENYFQTAKPLNLSIDKKSANDKPKTPNVAENHIESVSYNQIESGCVLDDIHNRVDPELKTEVIKPQNLSLLAKTPREPSAVSKRTGTSNAKTKSMARKKESARKARATRLAKEKGLIVEENLAPENFAQLKSEAQRVDAVVPSTNLPCNTTELKGDSEKELPKCTPLNLVTNTEDNLKTSYFNANSTETNSVLMEEEVPKLPLSEPLVENSIEKIEMPELIAVSDTKSTTRVTETPIEIREVLTETNIDNAFSYSEVKHTKPNTQSPTMPILKCMVTYTDELEVLYNNDLYLEDPLKLPNESRPVSNKIERDEWRRSKRTINKRRKRYSPSEMVTPAKKQPRTSKPSKPREKISQRELDQRRKSRRLNRDPVAIIKENTMPKLVKESILPVANTADEVPSRMCDTEENVAKTNNFEETHTIEDKADLSSPAPEPHIVGLSESVREKEPTPLSGPVKLKQLEEETISNLEFNQMGFSNNDDNILEQIITAEETHCCSQESPENATKEDVNVSFQEEEPQKDILAENEPAVMATEQTVTNQEEHLENNDTSIVYQINDTNVVLQIADELLEINVTTQNGKKIISVKTFSDAVIMNTSEETNCQSIEDACAVENPASDSNVEVQDQKLGENMAPLNNNYIDGTCNVKSPDTEVGEESNFSFKEQLCAAADITTVGDDVVIYNEEVVSSSTEIVTASKLPNKEEEQTETVADDVTLQRKYTTRKSSKREKRVSWEDEKCDLEKTKCLSSQTKPPKDNAPQSNAQSNPSESSSRTETTIKDSLRKSPKTKAALKFLEAIKPTKPRVKEPKVPSKPPDNFKTRATDIPEHAAPPDKPASKLQVEQSKKQLPVEQSKEQLPVEQPKKQLSVGQLKKQLAVDLPKKQLPAEQPKKQLSVGQLKKQLTAELQKKQSPVEQPKKQLSVGQLKKQSTDELLKKQLPVEQLKKQLPAEKLKRQLPVERLKKQLPAERLKKQSPVDQLKKQSPVVQPKKQLPVEQLKKQLPVDQVKKQLPVEQLKKELPVEKCNMKEETSADSNVKNVPKQKHHGQNKSESHSNGNKSKVSDFHSQLEDRMEEIHKVKEKPKDPEKGREIGPSKTKRSASPKEEKSHHNKSLKLMQTPQKKPKIEKAGEPERTGENRKSQKPKLPPEEKSTKGAIRKDSKDREITDNTKPLKENKKVKTKLKHSEEQPITRSKHKLEDPVQIEEPPLEETPISVQENSITSSTSQDSEASLKQRSSKLIQQITDDWDDDSDDMKTAENSCKRRLSLQEYNSRKRTSSIAEQETIPCDLNKPDLTDNLCVLIGSRSKREISPESPILSVKFNNKTYSRSSSLCAMKPNMADAETDVHTKETSASSVFDCKMEEPLSSAIELHLPRINRSPRPSYNQEYLRNALMNDLQAVNAYTTTLIKENQQLMQRFLEQKRLTADELKKVKTIIRYKRLVQHLSTIKINEMQTSSSRDGHAVKPDTDSLLYPSVHLKLTSSFAENCDVNKRQSSVNQILTPKANPLHPRKKKRFRFLYSDDTEEMEPLVPPVLASAAVANLSNSEEGLKRPRLDRSVSALESSMSALDRKVMDYSVHQGNSQGQLTLVFKRSFKSDPKMQPFVKLERLPSIDLLAKNRLQ